MRNGLCAVCMPLTRTSIVATRDVRYKELQHAVAARSKFGGCTLRTDRQRARDDDAEVAWHHVRLGGGAGDGQLRGQRDILRGSRPPPLYSPCHCPDC